MPLDQLEPRGRLRFDMQSDGMVNKATGEVASDLDVRVYSCTGRHPQSISSGMERE